jgi:ATPase family associated with various cellular activities (AAA)/AAA lid domain
VTVLADTVRDEAIAFAKSCGHPAVEPRHVLWGLLLALRDDAPVEVDRAAVRKLLEPDGTSDAVPTVSEAAETALTGITTKDSAIAECRTLATQLGILGGSGVAATPVEGGASGSAAASGGESTAATETATAAPATPAPDTESSLLAELDSLIGLGEVKAAIRRLLALQHLNTERAAAGLPVVNASKHLVFTGDPGTGKTTVAGIVARLYKVAGLVSKGQLIQTGRADLVAGYIGQTALKVQDVVMRALGGVLFIDEAYALAQGGYEDFGEEAIATLVKMMEEHRDDLAVIAAGYDAEMREFIDSNPGLRSRFTHYIEFPNYSVDELVAIFGTIALSAQVGAGPEVLDRVRELVGRVINQPGFGNARYVRTVFEDAYANMASRVLADGSVGKDEIQDLVADDVTDPGQGPIEAHRPIGFQPR